MINNQIWRHHAMSGFSMLTILYWCGQGGGWEKNANTLFLDVSGKGYGLRWSANAFISASMVSWPEGVTAESSTRCSEERGWEGSRSPDTDWWQKQKRKQYTITDQHVHVHNTSTHMHTSTHTREHMHTSTHTHTHTCTKTQCFILMQTHQVLESSNPLIFKCV